MVTIMKKPMKIVMVFIITIVYIIVFILPCFGFEDYENLDRYLRFYDREFERALTQAHYAGGYNDFAVRLESKVNVLRARWERDFEELESGLSSDGADGLAEELNIRYRAWEKDIEERITEAHVQSLYRNLQAVPEELEKAQVRLIERLDTLYASTIRMYEQSDDTEAVYEEFRTAAAEVFRLCRDETASGLDKPFSRFTQDIINRFPDADGSLLQAAVKQEKKQALYSINVLFSRILNEYLVKAYNAMPVEDTQVPEPGGGSASELVEEMRSAIERELDRRMSEELEDALGIDSSILPLNVPGASAQYYEAGLRLWAEAAGKIVRSEDAWFDAYAEVYLDGVEAWDTTLRTIGEKKALWETGFDEAIEESLANWESLFLEMETGQEDLDETLADYGDSRQGDIDAYIDHISGSLGYGSAVLSELDSYRGELELLTRELLSPLVPADLDMSDMQIRTFINFMENYRGPALPGLYDYAGFWLTGRSNSELFDLQTHSFNPEHGSPQSATDLLLDDPTFIFLGSETVSGGFRIRMKLEAPVRRFLINYSGAQSGTIPIGFRSIDYDEDYYYSIECLLVNGIKWRRRIVLDEPAVSETGRLELGSFENLSSDLDHVNNLFGFISSMEHMKSSIVSSIQEIYETVSRTPGKYNTLMNQPEFKNEAQFSDYYFDNGNDVFYDEFDLEVVKTDLEADYWDEQCKIHEDVINYALSGSSETIEKLSADVRDAEDSFQAARQAYYGIITDELDPAEKDIQKKIKRLDREKDKLVGLQKAFQDAEDKLMGLRVEQARTGGSGNAAAIEKAEARVESLEGAFSLCNGKIAGFENDLKNLRSDYNSAIDRLNKKKTKIDEAYTRYVKTREILLYAQTAELTGSNSVEAVELNRVQFFENLYNKERADARLKILEDIKLRRTGYDQKSELSSRFHAIQAKYAQTGEAEAALHLVTLFKFIYDDKTNELTNRLDYLDTQLGTAGIPYLEKRSLQTMKAGVEAELSVLRNLGLARHTFAEGTSEYDIFYEALSSGGAGRDEIRGCLSSLASFYSDNVSMLFSDGNGIEKVMGSLEGHVSGLYEDYQVLIAEGTETYQESYEDYCTGILDSYLDYTAHADAYDAETGIIDREISFVLSGFSDTKKSQFFEYLQILQSDPEALAGIPIDPDTVSLLMLEERKTGLAELSLLYRYLSGRITSKDLTKQQKLTWGKNLGKLAAKYDMQSAPVVEYGDVVSQGIALDRFEISGRSVLRDQVKGKYMLIRDLEPIDYYNLDVSGSCFNDLLGVVKSIYTVIGEDKCVLEQFKFGLQSTSLEQEQERFADRCDLLKQIGEGEWREQVEKLGDGYNAWRGLMKEKNTEGEAYWTDREIEYIRERDEWALAVKRGILSDENEGLERIGARLANLADDAGIDLRSLERGAEDLEKTYVHEVKIPRMVRDYRALANNTFAYLKDSDLGSRALDSAVCRLRSEIRNFEEKRDVYEAEVQYCRLRQMRDMIVGEIRRVDTYNRGAVEDLLFSDGFSRSGTGYRKRVITDYSLVGGYKKEVCTIDLYEPYLIDLRDFALADIDRLRSAGDPTEREILIDSELRKLQERESVVLGNDEHVGDLYTLHTGRFPTGDEVGRYIARTDDGGLFSRVRSLFSDVMGKIIPGGGAGGASGSTAEVSEFQQRLLSAITHDANRDLETGHVMLEYQRLTVLESEARETKKSGFFNIPIVPGGPTLKSIGSVGVTIATGGIGGGAALAQFGWNSFTTAVTAAEGRAGWDSAGLDMLKDAAGTLLTGGFTGGGGIASKVMHGYGSVGNELSGVAKAAASNAKREMINRTVTSAVNAFEISGRGRLDWSDEAFFQGAGMGALSSFGTFGGSFAEGWYDVSHGATWSNGDFNYNLFRSDEGAALADFYNEEMKRPGQIVGELTRQALNNMTGAESGLALNILNSRDFGFSADVGMLGVTLGSSEFAWDATTYGLDVSGSGLGDLATGFERLDTYDERYRSGTLGDKQLYTAGNLLRYVDDAGNIQESETLILTLEEGRVEELDTSIEGLSLYAGDFGAGLNGDGVLNWNFNNASKYTSYMSYASRNRYAELLDTGRGRMGSQVATEEDAYAHAVQSTGLMDTAYHTADALVMNRMDSIELGLMIWEGLKNTFGVDDRVVGYYADVLRTGGDDLDALYMMQMAFMESIGVTAAVEELQASDRETVQAIACLYKGAMIAGGGMDIYEAILQGDMDYGYDRMHRALEAGGVLRRGEEENPDPYTFFDSRSFYVDALLAEGAMNSYDLGLFNEDLDFFYDRTLDVDDTDYTRLKDYQTGEEGIYGDISDIDEVYGNVFNNIFETVTSEGTEGLDVLQDAIGPIFDVSDAGYDSTDTWFLELYQEGVKPYLSFYEYYLGQEGDKLTMLSDALNGKRVNVIDTDQFNSARTHMIANIDYATMFFGFLNENVPGWEAMDWWEGYRSESENQAIYKNSLTIPKSPHMDNRAIDFGNIRIDKRNLPPDILWALANHSELFRMGELKNYGLHLDVDRYWSYGKRYDSDSTIWRFGTAGNKEYWTEKWDAVDGAMYLYFDDIYVRNETVDDLMNQLLTGGDMNDIYRNYLLTTNPTSQF